MDEITDLREARRRRLLDNLARAVLDLCAFEAIAAFCVELPGTSPPLYVALGDAQTLPSIAKDGTAPLHR